MAEHTRGTGRVIKFRAWTVSKNDGTKEMLDWETQRHAISEWIGNQERGAVLMQFTGLTDKNGKEIYEGDIVNGADGYGEPMTWEVSFACENSEWTGFNVGADDEGECEIIGNIYENPELLK